MNRSLGNLFSRFMGSSQHSKPKPSKPDNAVSATTDPPVIEGLDPHLIPPNPIVGEAKYVNKANANNIVTFSDFEAANKPDSSSGVSSSSSNKSKIVTLDDLRRHNQALAKQSIQTPNQAMLSALPPNIAYEIEKTRYDPTSTNTSNLHSRTDKPLIEQKMSSITADGKQELSTTHVYPASSLSIPPELINSTTGVQSAATKPLRGDEAMRIVNAMIVNPASNNSKPPIGVDSITPIDKPRTSLMSTVQNNVGSFLSSVSNAISSRFSSSSIESPYRRPTKQNRSGITITSTASDDDNNNNTSNAPRNERMRLFTPTQPPPPPAVIIADEALDANDRAYKRVLTKLSEARRHATNTDVDHEFAEVADMYERVMRYTIDKSTLTPADINIMIRESESKTGADRIDIRHQAVKCLKFLWHDIIKNLVPITLGAWSVVSFKYVRPEDPTTINWQAKEYLTCYERLLRECLDVLSIFVSVIYDLSYFRTTQSDKRVLMTSIDQFKDITSLIKLNENDTATAIQKQDKIRAANQYMQSILDQLDLISPFNHSAQFTNVYDRVDMFNILTLTMNVRPSDSIDNQGVKLRRTLILKYLMRAGYIATAMSHRVNALFIDLRTERQVKLENEAALGVSHGDDAFLLHTDATQSENKIVKREANVSGTYTQIAKKRTRVPPNAPALPILPFGRTSSAPPGPYDLGISSSVLPSRAKSETTTGYRKAVVINLEVESDDESETNKNLNNNIAKNESISNNDQFDDVPMLEHVTAPKLFITGSADKLKQSLDSGLVHAWKKSDTKLAWLNTHVKKKIQYSYQFDFISRIPITAGISDSFKEQIYKPLVEFLKNGDDLAAFALVLINKESLCKYGVIAGPVQIPPCPNNDFFKGLCERVLQGYGIIDLLRVLDAAN